MKEYTHDEVVKLMADITPGSWEAFNYGEWESDTPDDNAFWLNGPEFVEYDVYSLFSESDAKFIAAAPDIVRSLLAEVERLQRELERDAQRRMDASAYFDHLTKLETGK